MICKIFYRKVTGAVEKMRISKKEEKKCKIVETEKTKEISLKIVVFPEALIPKKLSILFVYSLLAFEEESLNIPSVSPEVVLCVLIKLISHLPSYSGRPSADIFKTLITDYQLLSILL